MYGQSRGVWPRETLKVSLSLSARHQHQALPDGVAQQERDGQERGPHQGIEIQRRKFGQVHFTTSEIFQYNHFH